MKKTLIVLAHPHFEKQSIANKLIIEKVKTIPGVSVKDLYSECPSFKFSIETEQAVLIGAESIIFQFPFYWYSVPGILKEWIDQVFTYGFAFGSTGDKLNGKHFLVSTTVGGPEDAYCATGYNNFTIIDLLNPLRQMADLTGMKFNQPIVSYNMIFVPGVYNKREEVERRAQEHARRIVEYIAR
jgi:putative NADPH-quinone reductase